MITDLYERSTLALSLLNLYPATIRESLILNSSFRKSYGLRADAEICFGDSTVMFHRSELFKCIREILAESKAQPTLKDTVGEVWRLEIAEKNNERRAVLSKGEQRFFLPDLSAISPDQSERLNGFEREAIEVNLTGPAVNYWREALSAGALADEDLDALNKEFDETPIRVAALNRSEIEAGTSSFSTLVPRSERYFDRLVGECKQSVNIADYANGGGTEHIQQLISWRCHDGFLLSLLLSSHSSNSSLINVDQINNEVLVKTYEWIQNHGDLVSKIGAIEIGLSILDKRPEIESYVKDIIEQILDDNAKDVGGRFSLLSALIVLVEGELSRTKILGEKPPFWRRLAAIAQASLIERCIIGSGVDIARFNEWALLVRGQQFYLQTLCDLRREPRWQPDFVSPNQLKAEFIGRINNAAKLNSSKIQSPALRDLLLVDGPKSIRTHIKFPLPFLPGPLEGGIESQVELPEEILNMMEGRLTEDVLNPESFIVLVNSALIFRIDSHHAQFATKALRTAKHQIKHATDKVLLSFVLRGLAIVAAVTRSVDLAEELRILIRKCRHEPGRDLSAEDALWIGLIAAAANSEVQDWCQFVGEWITNLAFQPLQQGETEILHSHVKQLFHIVPALWTTCGRAEAALNL